LGEFYGIAKIIVGQINEMNEMEGGKVSPEDLSRIASSAVGAEEINCYPGIPGYGCCELSLFISLSSSLNIKNKGGHLSCRQAIEKLVQHMQGTCIGQTRAAVLITDSWDADASHEWFKNLEQISMHSHLEIYLIAGRNPSEIHLF